MSRKLITAVVGTGVVGMLALGVCVAATSAAAAGDRPLVRFHDSSSHVVTGPSHLAPGFVGIHLTGPKHTLFQIVKSRDGAGKSALVKEGAETNQGNVKDLEDDFTAYGGSQAHGNDFYAKLDPGTYFALDVDAKSVTPSMIQKFTVSGRTTNAARPVPDAVITTAGDMRWAKAPNHIPASGYLRFRNHSLKNLNNTHFVGLQRLLPGKKYGDVKKVFEGKEPASAVFATGPGSSFDSGILSHGQAQVSTYSLKPGRYMLACFFPDRATGQPHAFMGMYRTVRVG